MGEVYRAEDLRLKRIVAVKFIAPELLADPQAEERFAREAQAAAALNHQNIAIMHELGYDDGQPFIVMEYVEGQTLSRLAELGPLEISKALDIAIKILEGLRAAHARGLAHCDLKCSNIMLTLDGEVKILDFGLSRLISQSSKQPDISVNESRHEAGAAFGTASYMSPEQTRGEPLDFLTDIFSSGVVLYELVAGRRPFIGATTHDLLKAILYDEPLPLSSYRDDVPLELESIIRKSLEKNSGMRYQSASEMLSDLRRLRTRLQPVELRDEDGPDGQPVELKEPVASPQAGAASRTLRPFRYHSLFLIPAILSAAAAALDLLPGRSQGAERFRDLALLVISASCFLMYARLRARAASLRQRSMLTAGAAFRGLLPFQESDRDRFYGRDIETHAVLEMVTHSEFRFGVLFGDSGCGKTSLIRAGLLPLLWGKGYAPIYSRSYKDPLRALIEECRHQSQLEICEGETPIEYLRRAAEDINAQLVVVCDQFEEFFVNFRTRREREPFISFIVACYDESDLPVRFLFSMRSDFLYLISSEFGGRIREPLVSSGLYHLCNFDVERAADIIEKSARRANLPLEPELSRQVASDLATGDTVLPSELQIVGERLQSKRIYTVQGYRSAGGKEPLVHSFLEDVIQASGDQEGIKLLLRSLISDENTRLTLPLDEITRRTQRGRQAVERSLGLLIQSRLIREIQDEEPWRYELMHEYLIEKINQSTGKVMDATQRANRLLRQYVSNFAMDGRTRIPIGKLWFIRRYSDIAQGSRERDLLKKSLRSALLKSSALTLVLVGVATIAAAALSVKEEWEGVRLSDGHKAAARQLAFSPDGRLLVSCGEDGKVIVWDFARREQIAALHDHSGWVTALAFSPDGKRFATGSDDQTVIVWDAISLEKIVLLREHQQKIVSVAFSQDGRLLATSSCSVEPTIAHTIIWDVSRWEKVSEIPRSQSYGNNLFLSDNRTLLFLNELSSWDVNTGELGSMLPDQIIGGNWGAISPDGSQLITVDGRGSVWFVDCTRRKLMSRHPIHRFHGRAAIYSPDGLLAASAAEDIVLWDAVAQKRILRLGHTAEVWSLAFSPDGRWLVSGHADGAILLWDVAEREAVANLNEHHGSVRAVAFSPDGKHLASASEDRSVIVWDTERGTKQAALVGHGTRVTAVTFSTDGSWIASSGQDGSIIAWDLALMRARWVIKKSYEFPSYCVAISPDGRFIAASHGVYDSASGRQVVDFTDAGIQPAASTTYGIDFSSDGRMLVCVSSDGIIFLWDAEKWQLLERLETGNIEPVSVSFSPDDRRLVTGDVEGAVRIWSIGPLRHEALIGRHPARLKTVSFSPDGERVVSAGEDQTIALWDVDRRRLITNIGTHTAPVLAAAFSPDGKRIASGEHDKSVRIYTSRRMLWGYRLD
jgi:WD40 repeat protein